MFAGIIEATAVLYQVSSEKSTDSIRRLWFETDLDFSDIKVGDSLAHNGVCLTVTALQAKKHRYAVDIIEPTLDKTNLALLKLGDAINLERSMRLQDRVHGHVVLGHVDETVKIINQRQIQNKEKTITVTRFSNFHFPQYLLQHGCIAVDGMSLTISTLHTGNKYFEVSLIPHTHDQTIARYWQIGSIVNIEYDYFVKAVQRQQEFIKLENPSKANKNNSNHSEASE